jgi:hypothetical protein
MDLLLIRAFPPGLLPESSGGSGASTMSDKARDGGGLVALVPGGGPLGGALPVVFDRRITRLAGGPIGSRERLADSDGSRTSRTSRSGTCTYSSSSVM